MGMEKKILGCPVSPSFIDNKLSISFRGGTAGPKKKTTTRKKVQWEKRKRID
jgi:hypothetical protein